jgi:hypothetical protein
MVCSSAMIPRCRVYWMQNQVPTSSGTSQQQSGEDKAVNCLYSYTGKSVYVFGSKILVCSNK